MTDPCDDKQRIEETKGGLLHDACSWILSHQDFRRWREDAGCRLLWIKGDPGKGKTMLLCGIINELEASLVDNCVVYFFCQATEPTLNNAAAVLRGLIYMLTKRNPWLTKHVQNEYKTAGAKLFEGPNARYTLSRILRAILQDPDLQDVYLVIDALDECQHDLPSLLNIIKNHLDTNRVKWVVSSRNRVDIEQSLLTSESRARLSLELKANAEEIAHAVNAYIGCRITELAEQWEDRSLQDYAQETLRTKAHGTFLWAALVVQELRNTSEWHIKSVLDEVPDSLGRLYDRMINQINQLSRDKEGCFKVLATITTAYRPLHLEELRLISGLSLNPAIGAKETAVVTKMCGSFLTIRDDTVFFVHQSAKDYLDTKFLPPLIANVHHCICVRSISEMTRVLRRDIYDARHLGRPTHMVIRPDPDPLSAIRYSCVYWVDHLKHANTKQDVQNGGMVHRFLEEKFLYWLEALALLQALSEGISSVSKLLHLTQVRIPTLIMT